MVNVNDITITSLETINAFDVVTGGYIFTLDELQNATIAQTEDKSEITGKHGRKLANVKRNKAITISGTNGMVSGGLLEVQTGGKFERKATEVLWTDYLTVRNNLASTLYTAIGTAGAEIEELYTKNTNGSLGKQLTQAAETPAAGQFTYNPDTKELKFSDIEDGTEIVVYYKRQIIADVLENSSEEFSGKCMLYIDAIGEDKCANVYRIQFFIPKADFNGEFNLEMGENQTVHEFEAESLAGACGAAGIGSLLWTYTIFGDTAEDAATGEEAFDKEKSKNVKLGSNGNTQFMENLDEGDTGIKWADTTGYVRAKFKKVENFTDFSNAENEKTGAYFAFELDDSYKGKPITVQRISGTPGEPKTAVDTQWVLRLTDLADTVFEFSCDGAVILTLVFSESDFSALKEEE